MRWTPHATVAAVIESGGRFLLVEELIDGDLVLNQPAGHLEPGESLLDAVIREVREETARDFRPEGLVGIYRWQKPGTDEVFLRVCFHGAVGDAAPGQALDEGVVAARWHAPAELAGRRLRSPLVPRAIDDYLAGARHPLALLREL